MLSWGLIAFLAEKCRSWWLCTMQPPRYMLFVYLYIYMYFVGFCSFILTITNRCIILNSFLSTTQFEWKLPSSFLSFRGKEDSPNYIISYFFCANILVKICKEYHNKSCTQWKHFFPKHGEN